MSNEEQVKEIKVVWNVGDGKKTMTITLSEDNDLSKLEEQFKAAVEVVLSAIEYRKRWCKSNQ